MPVLTPRLSSLWLGLVTPVYARVGRKLVESLRNETVVRDRGALELFPCGRAASREAIERALANEDREFAETRWSDALRRRRRAGPAAARRCGSRLVDSRVGGRRRSRPQRPSRPIRRIGGDTGWYYGDRLWRLRGLLDLLVGGAGASARPARPDGSGVGDTIDFWRVEAYRARPPPAPDGRDDGCPGAPGCSSRSSRRPAARPSARPRSSIRSGLAGLLYWYAIWPLHKRIFDGMLESIAARASTDDVQ